MGGRGENWSSVEVRRVTYQEQRRFAQALVRLIKGSEHAAHHGRRISESAETFPRPRSPGQMRGEHGEHHASRSRTERGLPHAGNGTQRRAETRVETRHSRSAVRLHPSRTFITRTSQRGARAESDELSTGQRKVALARTRERLERKEILGEQRVETK